MSNLPETPQWEDGIYQIEVSDPVLGGPDGISNRQAKQLAKRTSYLKQQVEQRGTDLASHVAAADPHTQYAQKASPVFTGTPTTPTPAINDNSKKLANTEFVAKALAALAGSAPEALDTLKELADALGNDPNFATTVLNKLTEKLAKDQNGADIPDPALFVKNLGLGNTKYGAPLIGQLIEWPLQKMPHEIWPDMGQEYIPYMAQSFDPVKYPLLSQLHPTNVLPADMRAYVARGWDNGRGVDTGRALMSAQSSGAPNLTGTVQNVVGILGAGSSGAALGWTPGGVSSTAKSGTDSGVISIVLDASISSKEYQAITEVRVKNVAWNMIVRAK
ncbi:TPA: phage tail protein [Kluyvera ascorbata]